MANKNDKVVWVILLVVSIIEAAMLTYGICRHLGC